MPPVVKDNVRDIKDSYEFFDLFLQGKIDGCLKCGAVFEDDDYAFASETGLCQYCHKTISVIEEEEKVKV